MHAVFPKRLASAEIAIRMVLTVLALASINVFFYVSRIPAEFKDLLDVAFFANYVSIFSITVAAALFLGRLLTSILIAAFWQLRVLFLQQPSGSLRRKCRAVHRFLFSNDLFIVGSSACVFFVYLKFGWNGGFLVLATTFTSVIAAALLNFVPRNHPKHEIPIPIAKAKRQVLADLTRHPATTLILLSVFSALLGVWGARENLKNTVLVRSGNVEILGALVAATGSGIIVLEGFDYVTEWDENTETKEYQYAFYPFGESFTFRTRPIATFYNPQPGTCSAPGCR